MKLKSMPCERPAVSYEAFDAALDCTREDKYTECLEEILKPLFEEEKYCSLIKQVYQALILIIANKYTKYDIQLPGELRQELFPFASAVCESRREMLGLFGDYSLQLNRKIEKIVSRSELVDKVIQYLVRHYREDINLSELAGEFCRAHLSCKEVQRKENCTVMQYLENIRLKKARELLDTSSLSISEISPVMTGYNDPNYFARSFKRYMKYLRENTEIPSEQNMNKAGRRTGKEPSFSRYTCFFYQRRRSGTSNQMLSG